MTIDGLRYAVIGSGSSANSYIFDYKGYSFIVDNGFSCKQAIERAQQLGFDPDNVKYIFLTHSHDDHFRGIEVLSRKLKAPVVLHAELNLNRKIKKHFYRRKDIMPGCFYTEGDFRFRAFQTSHDADFSLSYHFQLGPAVFTIITDTGVVSIEMLELASQSDVLFLEANYNQRMLDDGPYPYFLKQRILSDHGHLSNTAALSFLNEVGQREDARLKEVYFCHLSDTNNSPEVLAEDIGRELKWKGSWVICRKGQMQPQL
ncbi:MAG: MBL fold metallo-hydrolase [Spirochaetales bacterium]|nr:MBL fold metallo-hydrolase [Spirochaetales bacterium]